VTSGGGHDGAREWIWDLVVDRAAASPDLLCVLDESGRTLTFGALAVRAERTAAALAALGVGPGVPVAWQLPTWIEAVILTAALTRLGAVQVPLLPILRARELSVVLDQVRPAVVACPGTWRGFDYVALWESLAAEILPNAAPVVLACERALPESDDLDALPALDAARPGAREHRWVYFTSGTTGVPKGARHTDASVTAGPRTLAERIGLSEADRYPIIFPFTHVGGVGTFCAQLMTGTAALIDDVFDPERTIPYLAAQGVTVGAGGTPIIQLYLEHQRRDKSVPLFPELRLCLAGAAPKPVTMHATARDELGGMGCMSVYGLTEAPFTTVSSFDDSDDVLATTEGAAIDGAELRVVGLDGRLCGPGEEGELGIRGPNVLLGYLDPSLDGDAFDADGYFRTGDLARLDAQGNVIITGRIKEIIIRRGENIAAPEVEHVLLEHPAIAEVAVIGLPDERTGERCCAVVVLTPGATVTLAELGEFAVAAGLTRQKVPEQLEVVDVLPRNAASKVMKHELRAALLARDAE
jgi:cyclohexanecarboxylate-CoA ligase